MNKQALWNLSLLQCHKVGLSSLLQSQHCVALEMQINLEILGKFTNKLLEWQILDQDLNTLMVLNGFHKERQYQESSDEESSDEESSDKDSSNEDSSDGEKRQREERQRL
ncbi:hypothetical protein ACFX10_012605 [Malus domestica]